MRLFIIYTVDGITNGAVYAAVALALVMIFRATRIINYAQGAMAMFTTYIALEVIRHGAPYWLGFIIALATGLVPDQAGVARLRRGGIMTAAGLFYTIRFRSHH